MSYGQPVTLIACTAFAIGLYRTAARIRDFRDAERERATRTAEEAAADQEIESTLQVIRELAEPTLTEIAHGGKPVRTTVRSLEAALRDEIRGRSIAIEPLVTSLRSVRERGVDVILLDDLADHEVSPEVLDRAARWCADIITTSTASSLTVRIAISNTRPTVTISNDGDFLEKLIL